MTWLRRWTRVVVLAAAAACCLAGLGCSPTAQGPHDAAWRRHSANNLRQLAIAFQIYREAFPGKLPPARGEATEHLGEGYSWRVHLLPFIEQGNVYNMIRHRGVKEPGRPWDDPEVLKIHIDTYQPGYEGPPSEPNGTYYRVFVGPGTAFDPKDRGGEGLERKLLVVEAGEPVLWTKPEELEYSPDKPLPPLGGIFGDGFHGVYGDGEVRFFPKDTDEATLRAAITGTYQGERPGRKVHGK